MADTAVPHALTERSALEASASVHDVPSSDQAQKMSGCSISEPCCLEAHERRFFLFWASRH